LICNKGSTAKEIDMTFEETKRRKLKRLLGLRIMNALGMVAWRADMKRLINLYTFARSAGYSRSAALKICWDYRSKTGG
jgi:hypothetical protein